MVRNSRLLSMNLCSYLDGVELIDARPEVVGVSPECDLQQRQEPVHPGQQTLRTEEGIRSSLQTSVSFFFFFLNVFVALTCWLMYSWRECRQTRWLCRPDRSPWWSRAPPQTQSSWHGGCTCERKEVLEEVVLRWGESGGGWKGRRGTSWWLWRPSISAQSPGRPKARRSGKRQLVSPNIEWARLAAAHHQTGSAPGWKGGEAGESVRPHLCMIICLTV